MGAYSCVNPALRNDGGPRDVTDFDHGPSVCAVPPRTNRVDASLHSVGLEHGVQVVGSRDADLGDQADPHAAPAVSETFAAKAGPQ